MIEFEHNPAPEADEITWEDAAIKTYSEGGFDINLNSTGQAFFMDDDNESNSTRLLKNPTGDYIFFQNSATLSTITESSGDVFPYSVLIAPECSDRVQPNSQFLVF